MFNFPAIEYNRFCQPQITVKQLTYTEKEENTMAINLLELATNAISNSISDNISGMIGEGGNATQSAISSGLPAILAGLMSKAQSPGGAQEIFNQLDQHDGSILNNLSDSLFGSNQSGLLNMGASIANMIFGSRQSGVLGTLSRLAGFKSSSAASTILNLLGPIVMGLIGKQRAQGNLSVDGIKDLLLGQKEHISNALPNDMRESLGVSHIFDDDTRRTQHVVRDSVDTREERRGGLSRLLLPLALIAGALFLLSLLWPGAERREIETVEHTEPKAMAETESEMSTSVTSITEELGQRLDSLTSSIGDITDTDSAQQLASTVKDHMGFLDNMNIGSWSGEDKSLLQSVLGSKLEPLLVAAEKAYQIPGVKSVLEPAVSPLIEHLETL